MVDPIVLRIAKSAILERFDPSHAIDKEMLRKQYPFLSQQGAAFVTLNYASSLRGCIGSIIAHRTLLEDIIHNARSAAFGDPRFEPVKEEELSLLTLEVSILTPPQKLHYEDFKDLQTKVTPYKDGLILKYGNYQGTFLPQVWDQLPKPKQFLEQLAYKAGANPSIYANHPDIYIYHVEALHERFDAIQPL